LVRDDRRPDVAIEAEKAGDNWTSGPSSRRREESRRWVSRSGRIVSGNRSRFGYGQRASIQANRPITSRSRGHRQGASSVIPRRPLRLRSISAICVMSRLLKGEQLF